MSCAAKFFFSDSEIVSGWNESFWREAGLEDLVTEGYRRIGTEVLVPGQPVGKGLTQKSANELGLLPGTAVATSLIDAHAGGVGMKICYSQKCGSKTKRADSFIRTCIMIQIWLC